MVTAQQRSAAKAPGRDTGIEVHHTICEICTRGCGIDAYVKDGRIVKVKGTPNNPTGFGFLCPKGQGSRSYVYRKDRIRTPLRRVGARGAGEFEPISWDDAYRVIAERLGAVKRESGPDAVVFFSGYTKWYRSIYRRFIYSFGSQNYCTDDSLCYYSTFMANMLNSGTPTRPDQRNSGVFLGWAFNRYYSGSISETKRLERYKREQGLKVVIVDPRITVASQRLADVHLRPLPGTDGALAHGLANLFIQWGRIDRDYIDKHVHGFDEYAQYVSAFDLDTVERITTVPKADIIAAAHMLTENGPMSIAETASPLVHTSNGLQNYRAIMALSAITGNYDRKGGQLPLRYADPTKSGDGVAEELFALDTFPYRVMKRVGANRWPLFCELVEQGQDMDLARQIETADPYPIRALFSMGMNVRMFPNNRRLLKAIDSLDFVVDVDIFMTEAAEHADIVLPACTSFERGTFRNYGNGKVAFTKPVISPLYESRSDVDILCDLANVMDLPDPLLRKGYRACVQFMLDPTGLTVEELQNAEEQVTYPTFTNYPAGLNTETGYSTTTGRYELKSELIAQRFSQYGLDPLPTYKDPVWLGDSKEFPFILDTGGRLPNAIHSRLHDSPWHRAQRPDPMVDLNPLDAERIGVKTGDWVAVSTPLGSIRLKANVTGENKESVVRVFQGYREADVNSIIPEVYDPYSGYPNLKSVRCRVVRIAQQDAGRMRHANTNTVSHSNSTDYERNYSWESESPSLDRAEPPSPRQQPSRVPVTR